MLISANNGLYRVRQGKECFTVFEAVDFCGQAGFEAVDINFFATTRRGAARERILDGDWRSDIQRLNGELKARGLVAESIHTPKAGADEPQDVYEEYLRRSLEAAAMLGARYAVFHPLVDQQKTHTLVDETIRYFREYAQLAVRYGVMLAVENMFSSTPEQLLEICEALGCGVCWDTGHANIAGLDQYKSVTALGEHLKVLHVNDNYGSMDDHNPPYFGTVDWTGFAQALLDIQYEGAFNFEVNASHIPDELRMECARYLVKAGRLLTGRSKGDR